MKKRMQVFKWARIKLTALYLAIIMLITVSFSVGVYNILTHEVERFGRAQRFRIERRTNPLVDARPPFSLDDPDLINETRMRIAVILIVVDAVILVCSGLLGYFLAGWTLRPIKDMVDEQNRFISDASHEFKTPLTALKSSFEVFLREKESSMGDAKELIKDGIKDVDSLNSLATSLLELAQFEKPNHKDRFETLELDQVIGKAVDTIKPLAQKDQIKINYQESHLKVFGDKDGLIQLFTILLDNAVKYSSVVKSPARKSVDIVATTLDGKVVQVKVTDKGTGISAEDLPHVFDRFYRADSSRSKTDVFGYGLGLSIAKNIVESHGGKILIDSELGKGTTVQLNLRIDG